MTAENETPQSAGPAPADPGLDMVRRFVALQKKKRDLEAELRWVKDELAKVEPQVLTFFERAGVKRLTVDDMTVYVKRELWASKAPDVDWETACRALEEYGVGEFVGLRFNASQVSAWIRERDNDGLPPIPPELEGVLTVSEKFTVQAQKAR